MTESDTGTGTGRRARNKADKLRRIKEAAYALFAEKGYDQTTTREIASRAGVALGTIFTYASDKRDLLFLIFNDRQDELRRVSFAAIPENASFADQLEALFTPFYYHFAAEPGFTRYLLRELTFFTDGIQAPRFQEGRLSIVKRIRELVEDAVADGRLPPGKPSQLVAEMIFGLYQAELRRWLSEETPAVTDGLGRLRSVFDILIAGLGVPKED
ncbi:MAG: TetR/AcrR family transcriptional regulator [Alphaproteobacteria bacterium]